MYARYFKFTSLLTWSYIVFSWNNRHITNEPNEIHDQIARVLYLGEQHKQVIIVIHASILNRTKNFHRWVTVVQEFGSLEQDQYGGSEVMRKTSKAEVRSAGELGRWARGKVESH